MMKVLSRVGIALVGVMTLAMSGCGSGGDPSNFVVTADSSTINVMADYTFAVPLRVKALDSFNATVTLTAEAPAGFTCNPTCTVTTAIVGDDTVPVVFHFDTVSTLPGSVVYPIVFHGIEGKMQHDTTVAVAVTAFDGVDPPPDFDFTVSPAVLYELAGRGILKDDTRYTLTFTRYNHYTGPISGAATFDMDTFCSTATCSFVNILPVAQVPFIISTDANPGRHVILFTASAGNVTKTASAEIIVTQPPTGPPLPGGGG